LLKGGFPDIAIQHFKKLLLVSLISVMFLLFLLRCSLQICYVLLAIVIKRDWWI